MSTTTETTTRPPRAPAASVMLTAMAVVSALLLAPMTSAAAEPLPTGTYDVTVAAGQVTLQVMADGGVTLTASDGLVVQLAFDEDGRVLDEFTVTTDTATFRVEVELEDDGTYSSRIEQRTSEVAEGDQDEVVRTVARCAPSGMVARAVGLPNHGTIVSAAASGLVFEAEVTDPVTGDVTTVQADFSTLAGAEDFCAQVGAAVPTLDEVRETLQAEAAAARADRATAQRERAAAQAALARARAAERAAERSAAAEGAGGRPEDPGASRPPSSTTPPGSETREDPEDRADGATDADDATDQDGTSSSDTSTGTDTTDGDSATDGTDSTATADPDGDETPPEPGGGNGKPGNPAAKGKGTDR